MILPITWLKRYINTKHSPKKLGGIYTSIGHMLDAPIKGGTLSLEVRQNRPDCLSILGLAKELAAYQKSKIKKPNRSPVRFKKYTSKYLKVVSKSVTRFSVVHIKNVRVGESPKFIKDALISYGVPPINNIVDITNYVTIELGVPLHAFDKTKVINGKLVIRTARDKENFTSLDGTKYNLTTKDTVIADKNSIIGLAGIVGGDNTRVDKNTEEILLEAATYSQAEIRKSSKYHQIRTEASTRHEKFLHPHGVPQALERTLYLLERYAGGELVDSEDYFPIDPGLTKINFDINEVKRLGGVQLKVQEIIKILKALEFEIINRKNNILSIEVPFYRTDIEQEADIVEEVLRIHGYDNIPFKMIDAAPPENITPPSYILEEQIRDILVSLGVDEQITNPMIKSSNNPSEIQFENPVNQDRDALRTSLKQTLLPALDNYRKHKIEEASIFEIGKIYYKLTSAKPFPANTFTEESRVGVIFDTSWKHMEYKGILEKLLERLGIKEYKVYSDGWIKQSGMELGKICNRYFYLKIDSLVKAKKSDPTEIITEFTHEIIEDISLITNKNTNVGPIIDIIKNVSKLVSSVDLIDLIEDAKFGKDKKSITLRIRYKTSDAPKVKSIKKEATALLEKHFPIKIRS